MSTEGRVLADNHEVAEVAAKEFVAWAIANLQNSRLIHGSITGGSVGILTLAKISETDGASEIDWSRIHIWWGDERFVAIDSADRNAVQAREALLSKISIPAENIHEFPAYDPEAGDIDAQLEAAALAFDSVVANYVDARSGHVPFDLTFLGMGPDGHIASLFPGHALPDAGTRVLAEHDSPKPPPQRLSFSYEALNNSREVWFVVAGVDKAEAVEVAFSTTPEILPVGRVRGIHLTRWFLDMAAATKISK